MFPEMMFLYTVAFCRVTIGLVFMLSSISKVRDIGLFKRTISSFNILPTWFNDLAIVFFLCGEFAVVILVFIGGPFLMPGFSLAIFLLFVFSLALISVLARKVHISCNCFGASTKQITGFEVWRNVGFMIFPLIGCIVLAGLNGGQEHLGLAEWSLIGIGGVIFVAIWLHLAEIVQLFQLDHIKEESQEE